MRLSVYRILPFGMQRTSRGRASVGIVVDGYRGWTPPVAVRHCGEQLRRWSLRRSIEFPNDRTRLMPVPRTGRSKVAASRLTKSVLILGNVPYLIGPICRASAPADTSSNSVERWSSIRQAANHLLSTSGRNSRDLSNTGETRDHHMLFMD